MAVSTREQYFRVQQLRLMLGLKLAVLSVVSLAVLGLATSRPAAPATSPVVHELPDLTDTTYLRVDVSQALVPQVTWLARTGSTGIAVVDGTWKKMNKDARVKLLQTALALSGKPKELLVLNSRSELRAEAYGNAYHFYD